MSNLLVHWRFLELIARDKKSRRSDVLVAWWLLEHFNEGDGYAWPSINRLAKETGLKRDIAHDAAMRLVKHGYFRYRAGIRDPSAKKRRPNKYWPVIPGSCRTSKAAIPPHPDSAVPPHPASRYPPAPGHNPLRDELNNHPRRMGGDSNFAREVRQRMKGGSRLMEAAWRQLEEESDDDPQST